MWSDDEERKAKKQALKNLEEMSIEALEEYIRELEGEIQRARTTIAFKKETQVSAASLFNLKKS
jgi:uncharacterized small protein (DUF1192 family)